MERPDIASAAPPTSARVLAFLAILVGGAAGALIGFAVTDLQCDGDCGVATGLGLLVGAVLGAVGVGVVAVLVMRAMGEWRTIRDQDPRASRRNPSA